MSELLTAAQMRSIEAAAIASGAVTGLELMERAGRGVVEAIFEEWPELKAGDHRAVVLCGPGNNGGDGFVVARLLKEWGWEVEVFLYGDPAKLPPDAKTNYERWLAMGEVASLAANARIYGIEAPDGPDLILDALFGTGLNRPFSDLFHIRYSLYVWGTVAHARCKVVSVDVPSGLCADSGRFLGNDDEFPEEPMADLTVTFHAEKVGHLIGSGPTHSGKVRIVDIGLSEPRRVKPVNLPSDHVTRVRGLSPGYLVKNRHEHKFSHGHALILSGSVGHGGAARMAARGALRIGAGLVTLAPPPAGLIENAACLDAIMLKPVGDATALEEVLKDARINALCLGPGLGVDRAGEMLGVALGSRAIARPTVLDADALTALPRDPALFAMLHPACVLTPHGGEFARLFPDIAAKLEAPATKGPAYSKVDATREAAARAGCVVLFKGADTVIASPDGTCAINSAAYDRAAPWLATAGSGDVLAGFITGLMARGFQPQQAAETGAWLHVECARSFGPGLIAEDLPEELPKVFRALGV